MKTSTMFVPTRSSACFDYLGGHRRVIAKDTGEEKERCKRGRVTKEKAKKQRAGEGMKTPGVMLLKNECAQSRYLRYASTYLINY